MAINEFNFEVIMIMSVYAILNGLGSLAYKKSLLDKKGKLDSFMKFDKDWPKALLDLFKRPLWVLGLVFLVADFFIYQIALKKYEVSVVKPLVNLNLIFVITFGVFIMKDKFTKKEGLSIILIILGAVLISYQSEVTFSTPNILNLIVFSVVTIGLVGIGVFYLTKTNNLENENKNKEFLSSIFSGVLYGLGSIFNKSMYNPDITSKGYDISMILLFAGTYGMAFLYGQYAYSEGRMSFVSTLVNISSILIPFIGGLFIFSDNINLVKAIGFVLIIVGILFAYKPIRNENDSKEEIKNLR